MKANSKKSEYTTITEFEFFLFAGDNEFYASALRDYGIEGTEWHFASAEDALSAGRKIAVEEFPEATKILIQGGEITRDANDENSPVDFDLVYEAFHEITAA